MAPSGTAEKHARRRGFALTSYAYGATEMALGYDARLTEAMAAWRGTWHEPLTHQTGAQAGPESFTRVYDAFRITDLADGLRVAARSSRYVAFEPFSVFTEITGLGSLRIQRLHQTDVRVPAWRGMTTRHGETWQQPLDADAQTGRSRKEILILATPTAVAELVPGPADTADSSVAADFLAELDISWVDS